MTQFPVPGEPTSLIDTILGADRPRPETASERRKDRLVFLIMILWIIAPGAIILLALAFRLGLAIVGL